jgi:hypothetical protein
MGGAWILRWKRVELRAHIYSGYICWDLPT